MCNKVRTSTVQNYEYTSSCSKNIAISYTLSNSEQENVKTKRK